METSIRDSRSRVWTLNSQSSDHVHHLHNHDDQGIKATCAVLSIPLYLLRGPSNQTHPVSNPVALVISIMLFHFPYWKDLSLVSEQFVISCLYDLVHLSCSIFLFLRNKLLSNFLYCKTVICLFSKFLGSEIWKGLVGQLVSDPRGIHVRQLRLNGTLPRWWPLNALVWNPRVTWRSVCLCLSIWHPNILI